MSVRPAVYYSAAASALLISVTSCSTGTKQFTYKLTTEIIVDNVKFSGSAVRQVTFSENYGPMAGAPYRARAHGEAVVIDMGRRGKAFTLLYRAEPSEGLIYGDGCTGDAVINYIIARMKNDTDCSDAAEYLDRFESSKRTLEFSGPTTPTTIKFSDINKPGTADYLSKDFKLRYLISASDDVPTRRIFSDIPWLSRLLKKRLDGSPSGEVGTLPSIIGGSEFSTEPASR